MYLFQNGTPYKLLKRLVGDENHHWNENDMENGTTGNNRKSQLDPRGTRTPDPTITGRVLLLLSYRVILLCTSLFAIYHTQQDLPLFNFICNR